MASFSALKNEALSRQQRLQHYNDHILGLNAFQRHKKFIHDYAHYYGSKAGKGAPEPPVRTDQDTLRETYRFIRSEEDDAEESWEQRLAHRYYQKLFKEYCLADMSRYKEGKIGLRWRTEKEVVTGKGQFVCGSKGCEEQQGLHSYEVNFVYREAREAKQALVKLRVCPKHAYRLNYRKEKEREKKRRREEKRQRTKRRREGPFEESGDEGKKSSEEGEEEGEDKEGGGSRTGGDASHAQAEQGEEPQGGKDLDSDLHMKGGTLPADESIWRGKRPELEPNKDEEFDEYFRGMFL